MKHKNRRLFLFAGYDKDGIIDDTLLYYLDCLSNLGDIVLVMDCDVHDISKLKKLKNLLYIETSKHGEYDFGSYKRGYMWAHNKKILNNYDWVYFVNDSVYGPLWNLEPVLVDLESRGPDLTGMVNNCNKNTPNHIQSWFMGMSKKLVNTVAVYNFLQCITKQDDKLNIVYKYEVGMSRCILLNGFHMTAVYDQDDDIKNIVYLQPLEMLKNGIPFIKKLAFPCIKKIRFVYPYTTQNFIQMIIKHVERNGDNYFLSDILNNTELHAPYYSKHFRCTIFSFPVLTIYKKTQQGIVDYKICLADKLPVLKLSLKTKK